jgi:hypothetical protein
MTIKRRWVQVTGGQWRVMMTSLRAKVHGKFTRNTRRNIRNSKLDLKMHLYRMMKKYC